MTDRYRQALEGLRERCAQEAERITARRRTVAAILNNEAVKPCGVAAAIRKIDVQQHYECAVRQVEQLASELRQAKAELARVRELAAKWRAAPQNPDEPLLAMAADELEAALSRPAEQHDPLAVSDHCGECGEPEPECACDERIEDYRESGQEGKE